MIDANKIDIGGCGMKISRRKFLGATFGVAALTAVGGSDLFGEFSMEDYFHGQVLPHLKLSMPKSGSAGKRVGGKIAFGPAGDLLFPIKGDDGEWFEPLKDWREAVMATQRRVA